MEIAEEQCANGQGFSGNPTTRDCPAVSAEQQSEQAGHTAAASAALASSGGSGTLRGQVINLTTGANETEAAAQAVSVLTQTISADPSSLRSLTTEAVAEAASGPEEVDGRGTEGGQDVARGVAGGEGSSLQSSSTGTANGVKLDAQQAEVKMEGFVENLERMTPGALVAAFRRAQEERVALYKRFDGGLKDALRSGDFSGYPALCCEITAAFSVLSKAINSIESLLAANDETKPLAVTIRKVQGHEKELITVTAAHHLESMRESRALGFGPGMNARFSGNGDAPPISPVQNRLLEEGVRELKRRADEEAAAVTELLEELRYEADGLL